MYFANKKLTFIVNQKKIENIEIDQSVFDGAYDRACIGGREPSDKHHFEYYIAVGFAISKYLGYKVFALHQSGDIAFEAYDQNGQYSGKFTVFSNYVDYHSINAHSYRKHLKDVA